MAAQRRTARDARRRSLGQNFLRPEVGRRIVASADFRPGELVIEIGAGRGALTQALAELPLDVVALELDPVWAARLRAELAGHPRVRVVCADFFAFALPERPFRVIGSLPFGRTTDVCRRLFDDPALPLARADLIVQWEVAKKRATSPPGTLLGATWAPWWEFRLGGFLAAASFRPVPRTDAGVLVATRRPAALLPPAMAVGYADFVRARWPFTTPGTARR